MHYIFFNAMRVEEITSDWQIKSDDIIQKFLIEPIEISLWKRVI